MGHSIVNTPAGPSRSRSHLDLHDIQPDVIIIGAGIAGCALAYSLSVNSHRRVLLLERDLSEPDRIVGELLQPGGVAALNQLGLGHVLEGIDATPVEGYCVVSGGREVGIPYPDIEKMTGGKMEDGLAGSKGRVTRGRGRKGSCVEAFTGSLGSTSGIQEGEEEKTLSAAEEAEWHVASRSGRKEGRSFHHGRLISSLRNACLSVGPDLTVLEATVRDLVYCEHTNRVIGVSAAFKSPIDRSTSVEDETNETASSASETIVRKVYAPITIVADGCFSKFRTLPNSRVPKPKTRSHFVGLVLKDADLPLKYHGNVFLTPSGPVLLYQIGDKAEETRMLVDVKGKLPSVGDGSLKQHILDNYLPHLTPPVQSAVQIALDNQRLRTMPNSFLPPSMQGRTSTPGGLIMVGDAWNMRHPLTGGGMTVAFNDAVLLTHYLGPERLGSGREGLEDWGKVAEGLRQWFWERKKVSGVINVMSMALYDLFGGADEPDLEILREGCFRYFELGGDRVAGPVGLLSALTPKPLLLFYHFFSVAFYSIYILLTQGMPPAPGTKGAKPGWTEVPGLVLFSGRVFWTACVVLLPMIWTEFKI